MDSFELNKIAGGVLGALTFVMLTSFAASFCSPRRRRRRRVRLPMPEGTAAAAAGPAKAAAEPIAVRLASADKTKGEAAFRQCSACHANEKGGANKVGPALWNVLAASRVSSRLRLFRRPEGCRCQGREVGLRDDRQVHRGAEGLHPWHVDVLRGISNAATRATWCAYLNTLADSPLDLPKP